MNEHSIFLAALEIADPSQRASYLDQACADNPSLREQVEALFKAHERSGEFLDVPVLKQLAGDTGDPNIGGETRIDAAATEGEIDLSFLEASTVPGSLGRLRHYEVREVIGRGGCGIVLKAFDSKLERIVAIKVMAPELAATSPARKRFLREARATAAIRHENVVSIYAVEEKPLPFLVMEYIDGETLQQRLDRTGPLDVSTVLRIGQQIASGLAAAHGKGLIHRDIKPSNILLEDGTDHLKITDFGLARSADDASMTQSGVIAGTPLYMSPEQAQAHDIDHRSDLFSLGSVLYVMCSGRPPFRAATTLAVIKRVVEEQPRSIQGIIPEVPEWLIAIIAKLHAKGPEDRFASAQEVGDLLARCLAELEQHGRVELSADILAILPQPESEMQEADQSKQPESALETATTSARSRGRSWATAAAIVLVLLAGLGVTEATGVTNVGGTVIRLFSPEGTLVVAVDDPGVSVTIDGEEMVITGTGAKEIRLKPGQYKLLASKNGKVVHQELVTVTNNGRQVVRVSREAAAPRSATPPDAQAQTGEVTALSANDQAEKVRQDLRRRNPDFRGVIAYDIEVGRIVGCKIVGGTLPDLSPLSALAELQHLDYEALDPQRDAPVLRKIVSLETINGYSAATFRLAFPANKPADGVDAVWLGAVSKLPAETQAEVVVKKLKELNPNFDGRVATNVEDGRIASLRFVSADALTDLSPLRAFKHLKSLEIPSHKGRGWLSDVSPLEGMSLAELSLVNQRVTDLSPLKGMPLTSLELIGMPVADLSPLAGTPLKRMDIFMTNVSDLAPLKSLPLEHLNCNDTFVWDLSPLKGMPLKSLWFSRTRVTDLSPLEGLKLNTLTLAQTRVLDLSPLEGMPLTSLNFTQTRVSDLSPLAGMRLENLSFAQCGISDLSPLKEMPLKSLVCNLTRVEDLSPLEGMPLASLGIGATRVTDLTPLKGMRLNHLQCYDTRVSDLSPLKSMPLEFLWIPEVSPEKLEVLRGIESLKTINDKPAAEFWKQIDAR